MNKCAIESPTGEETTIPITVDNEDIYFKLDSDVKLKEYYEENGYVVVRNSTQQELCHQAVDIFNKEVKPFQGHIYRQASANLEKHIFTEGDHMLNSILNVQSLHPKKLKAFRQIGLEVLTNNNLKSVLNILFGDAPKLVQSMFFDGNPVTWAHQDTYYLDSENFNMAGVWFAMEDIAPDAGRFYIYPQSHKIDVAKNGGNFNIAFNHDRYKKLVIDIIKNNNLSLSAPALQKGDILIWNSKTIHGCLPTIDIKKSRKSFTGHFIPEKEKFLQYQTRIKPLNLKKINDLNVNFPKDLSSYKNRMIYQAELNFPKTFRAMKKRAVQLVTK
jgi:phytanoyl-CoA hydroxylase